MSVPEACPSDQHYYCPSCQRLMIHQERRRMIESSSAYGQHVREHMPVDFNYMDIDAATLRRVGRQNLLRIIEHKWPGQSLSNGQRKLLPLLAAAIQLAVAAKRLHPDSGVFELTAETPFDYPALHRLRQITPRGTFTDLHLTAQQWQAFKEGRPISHLDTQTRLDIA